MARAPSAAEDAAASAGKKTADKPHGPSLLGTDAMVERNRLSRGAIFVTSMIASAAIPSAIGDSLGGSIGAVVGLAIGVKVASSIAPWFIVRVAQAQVFVTINSLHTFLGRKGEANVTYGPGMHAAYPWEERDPKGNLSLDIITLPFEDEVPGKDTRLKVKGSMQFRVDIKHAPSFIGIDQSTIQGGIVDLIKSTISSKLATMGADDAKAAITQINTDLMAKFGFAPPKNDDTDASPDLPGKDSRISDLEKQYSIEVVAVTIAEIDLPEKVQASRDALDQAEQVFKGVAKLMGLTPDELRAKMASKEITLDKYNETVDRFFVQSGNANMDVKSFKFNDIEALGTAIGNALRGRS